jgi:hypothetical protein
MLGINSNELDLKGETENLQKVKRMVNVYPLETTLPDYEANKHLLFQFRNYIDIIPAFVKTVDFTDHSQVLVCYNYLEHSE